MSDWAWGEADSPRTTGGLGTVSQAVPGGPPWCMRESTEGSVVHPRDPRESDVGVLASDVGIRPLALSQISTSHTQTSKMSRCEGDGTTPGPPSTCRTSRRRATAPYQRPVLLLIGCGLIGSPWVSLTLFTVVF